MIGFGQGWENKFGTGIPNWGNAIQQTIDGGFIVTGYSEISNNRDVSLIKIDINGIEEWSGLYGGFELDYGNSVDQTADGGYIIAGRYTYNMPNSEIYLIKTDANGVEQWNQTFTDGVGFSVQQTIDGGYIICNSGGLLKTDGNGTEQWRKTYIDNSFKSFQQTADGGYIITGFRFGNGDWDVSLIKTDGNGIEQWAKTFGGSGYDVGNSVQQTADGGYIITGSTEFNANAYLLKTDHNGVELWNRRFGDTSVTTTGQDVIENNGGGYTICGSYMYDTCKVYVINTDSYGNVTSTLNIPIPNAHRKLKNKVDLSGRETKGKTNQPLFYLYDDGTVEKRIVIE